MAMGRLLAPKLTPHFRSRGFVPLTKRRSSSSSSVEDGRKLERLPDSNKDIGQKGMHWYSLGGFLTNLKEKIMGNHHEGSALSKSPMVSSGDVTVKKVVSLQDVAENINCIPPSVKEESLVSEIGYEDASEKVGVVEISGKRETISVEKEMLDSNTLDGLEFSQKKVLSLMQAERVELSSKDVSLGLVTEEALESMVSSNENQGKLQPENKLSNMFINLHPDKEVKPSQALSNSNSIMSTRESCSEAGGQHDPVQKMKNITKESDKQMYADALQDSESLSLFSLSSASHDLKSGDLAAIRERKTTYPFGSSIGTVVPVAVSKESSIKKMMKSLKVSTKNGTEGDANEWNPNGKEGKCVSEGHSVARKSDLLCATEEEESKGLCNQATLGCTSVNRESTEKSLDALSIREHSPNKVLLRFLSKGFQKSDIVESFSEFGAVLDVQEFPSFEGYMYKDALVTFETNSAVKKALKKGVVIVKHYIAIVEATSQHVMVEKIRIPDLIGDPDVPVSLVKEPTRTVKIHPLDQNIGSDQIREALRFCKSNISKIIFGSSTTAAFIEFETEDGKERALAAHSLNVLNKQLFISRIDIPRTTVVRISNRSGSTNPDIRKVCAPLWQIQQMFVRGKGVVDIIFHISEWPNMLTILNSMNGKEVNGIKWMVRPATTVIPPEILKVLWEDPQGKMYVKGLIKNMVREIEQPVDVAALSSLCSALED